MKVCFLTANYPPEAQGGTEQVVVALARELASHSVEVSVITGSDVRREDVDVDVREEQHDGVTVARVFRDATESDRGYFKRPRILDVIRQRLEAVAPDVVHVHAFAGLSLGITTLCRQMQLPVVVSFHDMWTTCARYFRLPAAGITCPTDDHREVCVKCINASLRADPEYIRERLERRSYLIRTELQAAQACTAPSRTAAALVRTSVPLESEVEVIPHGLLRPVASADRAASPTASEPLRVGTFGGLVASKGLRELVRACVHVVQAGHQIELHLSGPWHEPELQVEMRELALQFGLKMVEHGPFTSADRHPARDLHLAVFPSKCQETYGLVVEEALAHGVPAVVSNFGALAERAATPGVVVTPLDPLPNVLCELVASPERLAALRDAIPSELATIAVSANRHHDLYQSLR